MKKYIKLPDISNQKTRQKYYISEAVKHPAKADIPMMIWILKKFVKDGDIVLDPMAGIGTTLIEGMRLFPNSLFIGVELEKKFVNWCNVSIKNTEKIAKENWFMKVGKAICVQGDARELEKVVREKVNKIISSPPYADVISDDKEGPSAGANEKKYGRWKKGTAKKRSYTQLDEPSKVDKIISSPPFQQAGTDTEKRMKERLDKVFKGRSYVPTQKYENKDNISNISPYGQADKIISSPPWGGQIQHKTNYLGKQKRESGFEYSDNPENIGNLPQGEIGIGDWKTPRDEFVKEIKKQLEEKGYIEWQGKKYTEKEWRAMNYGRINGRVTKGVHKHPTDGYSRSKENIGNLKHGQIDKIITSPPFAGNTGGHGAKSKNPINAKYPGLADRMLGGVKGGTGENPNGNC